MASWDLMMTESPQSSLRELVFETMLLPIADHKSIDDWDVTDQMQAESLDRRHLIEYSKIEYVFYYSQIFPAESLRTFLFPLAFWAFAPRIQVRHPLSAHEFQLLIKKKLWTGCSVILIILFRQVNIKCGPANLSSWTYPTLRELPHETTIPKTRPWNTSVTTPPSQYHKDGISGRGLQPHGREWAEQ